MGPGDSAGKPMVQVKPPVGCKVKCPQLNVLTKLWVTFQCSHFIAWSNEYGGTYTMAWGDQACVPRSRGMHLLIHKPNANLWGGAGESTFLTPCWSIFTLTFGAHWLHIRITWGVLMTLMSWPYPPQTLIHRGWGWGPSISICSVFPGDSSIRPE